MYLFCGVNLFLLLVLKNEMWEVPCIVVWLLNVERYLDIEFVGLILLIFI